MIETVAILGASNQESRYAYQAFLALSEAGHLLVPINPKYDEIDGVPCYGRLLDYQKNIDTITVYVKPSILLDLLDEIIASQPKRVIFNPGTEDDMAVKQLNQAGIKTEYACTLVLLKTNQYSC